MAEVEIDAAILEKTRKELGAIIKTPKLSDRLLKKPPFRFLHDIVTNVIKATQFATQLYTEDELDSSKCTEKDAKVFFLQKIISSVNYTLKLDPPLAAKPIKIVSGLEPEHTNTFLQELARATKVPKEKSDKAIAKVLQKLAEKQKAAAAKGKDEKPKDAKPPQPSAPPAPDQGKDEGKSAPVPALPIDDQKAKQEEEARAKAAAEAAPSASERPATAAKPPPPQTSNEEPSKEPRTVGRSKGNKEQDDSKAPVGVIVDKKDKGKKEGKGTLDTDSEGEDDAQDEAFNKIDPTATDGEAGPAGYLQRMAQAQKEEEMAKLEAAKAKEAERSETPSGQDGIRLRDTRGGKDRKEREVFSTEVSKLRDSIKMVVKAAMPLGQTFDYVQEDIDSMAKEYMSWKRQAQDTKVQHQEIERTTGEQLQPLHTQLQELEDAINDQLNKIHTVKANILKNDETIATLLRMVINSK